jgi:hypothetical protein
MAEAIDRDRAGSRKTDRVAAGAPIRKLLFIEALGHARVDSPGSGRITAPGSSWPQSTRIVQRKRRPTSNVDSMMVLRARRGGTGSKYVTLRGGLRRAIPFLLVRSGGYAKSPILCGQTVLPACVLPGDQRQGRSATCRANGCDARVWNARVSSGACMPLRHPNRRNRPRCDTRRCRPRRLRGSRAIVRAQARRAIVGASSAEGSDMERIDGLTCGRGKAEVEV